MNEREAIRRYSITSSEPAMNPPQEARLLEKVPIRRSTSSSRPKSSQAPAPRAPRTPTPCASSTISRAPWRRQRSTIGGRSQTSPSMEKTPSTTTSVPLSSATARSSIVSSLSIRLWRNGRRRAPESLQPSRIEAWSPESQMTVSPGSRMALIAPRFDW